MTDRTPELSVIIPVLNEGKTLRTIVDRVLAVDLDMELLLIDDGSTDGTPKILESIQSDTIRIFTHDHNKGKGAAIRTAVPHIRGTYAVIQDGDLEYDPQDFIRLMDEIKKKNGRVIYGSRILSNSKMSYLRYWIGGRGVTFATNLLYGSKLTDEPTCYKLFESKLLQSLDLQSTGFEFCPEVTGLVLKMKIPIIEIPIKYEPRSIQEGKKIRWQDGVIALWVLFKIRFFKSVKAN